MKVLRVSPSSMPGTFIKIFSIATVAHELVATWIM